TPISTIYGNGLLLMRRGDQLRPDDRAQALEDIVGEAGKLQEIIENLLLLTRLEGGQLDLEPIALQFAIADDIREFAKQQAGRAITFEAEDDIPIAQGQRTLIDLVLRNLLSNAAKYSPHDAPIEVRLYLNP